MRATPPFRDNATLVDGFRCVRGNGNASDAARQQALSAAVAEEFALFGDHGRAADEYANCARLFARTAGPHEDWARSLAGWCRYVPGLLDERAGRTERAREAYEAAFALAPRDARWTSLRGVPLGDLLAKPAIALGVDARSWLATEFAAGWRLCARSSCGVARGPQRGDRTAYVTHFQARGGHEIVFPYADAAHANAVVFMENDGRFANYERALAAFGDDVDVTLGFSGTPPLPFAPHRPLSYVTDGEHAFRADPAPYAHKAKRVLWVASQCDGALDRLARVDALARHLGDLFLSLGACRRTSDIADAFPGCAGLDTDARGGGGATVDADPRKRCAYRHSAFVLAYENSVAQGYATEKLWQALAEGAVPVYHGAPDVVASLPAPEAAVIADDFESPAHLAEYLRHCLVNETTYASHLAWRKGPWAPGFRARLRERKESLFCEVCDFTVAKREAWKPDPDADDIIVPKPVRPGGKIYDEPVPEVIYLRHNVSRKRRDLEVRLPLPYEILPPDLSPLLETRPGADGWTPCYAVSGETRCGAAETLNALTLSLPPGKHVLDAWLERSGERRLASSTRFSVAAVPARPRVRGFQC